jgi:8-hydroxy-5-deazaflavin:NADPH oxidoreductase
MHHMDERVGRGGGGTLSPPSRTIGIVGGTGPLGRGLARRLASAGHDVRIGSRDRARAESTAASLGVDVQGVSNSEVCASEIVIVAVPWTAHDETIDGLRADLDGRVVVDCVNPLGFDERGPYALAVEAGSAAQQAQLLLPGSTVVGAFHHVSSELLLGDDVLDGDVLVVGDDRDAVNRVIEIVDSVGGLRGVFAGRLRNSGQVEALTANLIAINRRYKIQAGLRVTGLGTPTGH